MGRRAVLNLVLAAVVAGLAWLTFAPPEPGDSQDASLAVTSLDAAAIRRIEIRAGSRPAMRLAREAGGWMLESPRAGRADPLRVQALLGLATARSRSGFRAAGNDLGQFGLAPPRATVTFDDAVVAVGDTDPVASLRYVLARDQVHLLEDRWFSQIFGEAVAWLDPRLLSGVTALGAIRIPGAHWTWRDGQWHRQPPGPGAQAGAALAKAWRDASALAVRDLDERLDWSAEVSVTPRDGGEPLRFVVARTADAVFLGRRDRNVQYRFLPRQAAALLPASPPGPPTGPSERRGS